MKSKAVIGKPNVEIDASTSKNDLLIKGMSQPALRALKAAGYTSLNSLTHVREKDLAKLHGMGPKALGILRAALKAKGSKFAQ